MGQVTFSEQECYHNLRGKIKINKQVGTVAYPCFSLKVPNDVLSATSQISVTLLVYPAGFWCNDKIHFPWRERGLVRKFLRFWTNPITIRHSLLRNMVLLVFLTCGAIGLAGYMAGSRTVASYSKRLMDRTIDRTEAELNRLFDPVEDALLLTRDWAWTELLDVRDPAIFNRLFMPLLDHNPQISAMIIANTSGEEWALLRDGETWLNIITKADSWGKRNHTMRWRDSETLIEEWWEEVDYDPRQRPWFRGAMSLDDANHIHWTEPYTFATVEEPGITASTRLKNLNGDGVDYVIGCDVLLIDISRFTTHLQVSRNGKAVVITRDGKVIGLPRDKQFTSEDSYRAAILFRPDQLGIPTLSDARRHWLKSEPQEVFEFGSEGSLWWGEVEPFTLRNQVFWIAVFIPKADFLDEFYRSGTMLFFDVLLVLLIGVFMAIRMARRYSQPLERLASRSRRLRDLDLINYHPVESRLAEVNQLSDAHSQMLTAMQSFAKYTPVEVVRELLKRGEVAKIGGRTASLTLMFSDIRGFTTIAEGMAPQALADHMAEYFEEVLRVLRQNKATIDKFVGDAVVAFWGAPIPDPEHTENAILGVLRCSLRLGELNRDWEERGLPPLPTCFGLTTGSVVVGNIGSRSRLSYTVLGDAANLASRIEGINRLYGTEILVEESVTQQAGKQFAWRYVDRVTVKGKSEAVRIYELLGLKDEVPAERLQFAEDYERALSLYQSRGFSGAIGVLEAMKKPFSEDLSVIRLAGFCRQFLLDPPPKDWDGVSHLEVK